MGHARQLGLFFEGLGAPGCASGLSFLSFNLFFLPITSFNFLKNLYFCFHIFRKKKLITKMNEVHDLDHRFNGLSYNT